MRLVVNKPRLACPSLVALAFLVIESDVHADDEVLAANFAPILILTKNPTRPSRIVLNPEPIEIMGAESLSNVQVVSATNLLGRDARVDSYTGWTPPLDFPGVDILQDKFAFLRADIRWHYGIIRPGETEADDFAVRPLFFDYPGHDKESWNAAYLGEGEDDSRAGWRFPNTVYASVFQRKPPGTGTLYTPKFFITYFLFFPFNDWQNNHEGDWQKINVMVTSRDTSTAKIEGIDYLFHGKSISYYNITDSPSTINVRDRVAPVNGKYPVAYVTAGGHGSFPTPGNYPGAGAVSYDEDLTPSGVVLHPEIAESHMDVAQSYRIVMLPHPDEDVEDNMGIAAEFSWLGADLAWGTPDVASPATWLPPEFTTQRLEASNDAAISPFHKESWAKNRENISSDKIYDKGDIPSEFAQFHHFPIVGDVNWSGTVSLRGDIVIFPGATLTLVPGTIVEFEPMKDIHEFPAQGHGLDDRAEIFVYGTLDATDQANPIQFRKKSSTSWSGTHAWGGIRIMAGGSADLEHTQIQDMSLPPLPPTQVTAEAGNGQVTLRWTDPIVEDPTITGWEYRRQQGDGSGTWTPAESAAIARAISGSGSATTETPPMDHGVFHRFQVRAVNAAGGGPWSDSVKVPLMAVSYSAESYGVAEGQSVEVTVRVAPVADRAMKIPIVVSVDPDVVDAAESGDYSVSSLSLAFLAGDSSKRFTITANSDTDGDDEWVSLGFGSTLPVGVQAGAQATASLRIHESEDDAPENSIPGRPTVSSATAGASSIQVVWTAVKEPAATGYRLRFQTKPDWGPGVDLLGGLSWSAWNVCPLLPGMNRLFFTHNGVNASTRYRYELQATNGRGDSDWSPTFPPNGVSPLAPQLAGIGVRSAGRSVASSDEFEITVDCFEPVCEAGAGGLTVLSTSNLPQFDAFQYQARSGSGVWSRWGSASSGVAGASGASGGGSRQPVSSPITFSNRVAAVDDSRSILSTYGVSDLDTTMVHQIRVRLVNADNVAGGASDSVAVVPLRARRGDGQVTLEWDNPGNDLVEEWQYRLNPDDGRWGTWQDVAGSDSSTATCTVADLTNGVAYRFQVQGVYETAAMDSRAAVASFTRQATPAGVPEAPGSLSASTGGDWVTLDWTRAPDNGSPLTGYGYRHSIDGGTTWVPDWETIAGSDSTTTSHTLESLRTGTEYTFEVRAVNAVGAGDASRVTATPAWSGSLSESTTWADTVYVNGDVTVASGVTLTLSRETEVRFVDGTDVIGGGTDMGLSELIVAAGGVLEAGAGQVTFRPAGYPPSSPAWYGVRAEGKAVLTGASLRDGKRCAGVEGSGTLVLGRTRFGDCGLVSGSRLVSFAENGTDTVAAFQAVAPLPASVQWSLTGVDAGDFSIDTQGWLRFGSTPDYEAAVDEDGDNEYRVTVQARAATDTATQAVVVRVTDVPVEDLLSGPDAVEFAENDTALVGRYAAAPAQGATVTWPPLIGDDAGRFRLDGSAAATRLLRFLTPPNYEAPVDADRDSVYHVKVVATDGTQPDTVAVAVRVTNVNEAPPVAGASDKIFAENGTGTVATYTATDPEGDPVGWSLIGTDADTLRLDASGRLTFRAPPDYEAPGDQGSDNRYDVKVVASDGSLPDTLQVAVRVTDVNEPPTRPGLQPLTVPSTNGHERLNVSWTAPANGGRPAITGYRVEYCRGHCESSRPAWKDHQEHPAGARRATLTGLASHTQYSVRVRAVNAEGSGAWSVVRSAYTRNRAPTLSGASDTTFAENGTGTVATYTASDPDGDALTWSRAGADEGAFRLHGSGSSRSLRFRSAPNYEGRSTPYRVTVKVKDTGPPADSATVDVTVRVTDVNEPPTRPGLQPLTVPSTNGHERLNVSWTAPANGGRPAITGYRLEYCRGHCKSDLQAVWPHHQELAAGARRATLTGLASHTQYFVRVRAVNAEGDGAWSVVRSAYTRNRAPTLAGASDTTFAENGTGTVATYTASDPDGDALTWSRAGADADVFRLHGSGSRRSLRFQTAPNYEARSTPYRVTVKVKDTGPPADSATVDVTVRVTDVNEAPTVTGPSTKTLAEGGSLPWVVGTYTGTDPDGDALRFSRSGDQAGYFKFTGSGRTRRLEFREQPDYETRSSYEVRVGVRDRPVGGLQHSVPTTVTLTNVDEPGVVTLSDNTPTVGDDITAELRDPDGGVTGDRWGWGYGIRGQSSDGPDATSRRYTVQSNDAGRRLRVTVSYDDAHGTGKSAAGTSGTVQAAPPEAPSLTAAPGDAHVKLSWTQPRNNGATIDYYQWRRNGTNWASTGTARTKTVTGLTNGTTYTFYARAHNSAGFGPSDSEKAKPAGKPSAPKSLKAPRGSGRSTVSWSAADSNGSHILHYEIRQRAGTGSWSSWSTVSGGHGARSKLVTSLTNGTRYTFQVLAENGVGEGPADSASVTPAGPPGAPQKLATDRQGGNGFMELTWKAASANGSAILHYYYRYKKTGAEDWRGWYRRAGGANARSKSWSNFDDSSPYVFQVRARNDVGYGTTAQISASALGPGGQGARGAQGVHEETGDELMPEGEVPEPGQGEVVVAAKPVTEAPETGRLSSADAWAVRPGPNPFNSETTLRFQLPEAAPVTLTIHNTAGQRVTELVRGEMLTAGLHARVWFGTDRAERPVASGLYLYRLVAGDQVRVGKLALIR